MAKNDVTKSSKDKAKKAVTPVKKKGGLRRWFKELKSEMKKGVWPTRKKVINNTGYTVTVCRYRDNYNALGRYTVGSYTCIIFAKTH